MMTHVRRATSTLVFLLVIAAQLFIMSGCATLPDYHPQVPAVSDVGRILFDDWLARRGQTRAMQGVAKVKVQTPERSVNGTQVLLVEEPDRLRAETLSPFGTPLLVLTANDAELAVLVPGDNMFYRGRATPENLGRFTRLPLRLVDLVGILLSRPPLIAYRSLETFDLPDGRWLIRLEASPRCQELLFDAGQRLVEVRYLHDEELQLRLAYSEFDPEPQRFPRRIDLTLPQQQTQASLIFKEIETNRPSPSGVFAQSPPPGATVLVLDEMAPSQPPLQPESR